MLSAMYIKLDILFSFSVSFYCSRLVFKLNAVIKLYAYVCHICTVHLVYILQQYTVKTFI